MRRYLLIVPFLAACARAETPPADSAAAAAPAALTDTDVSGTWTGTLMPQGSDSVVAHWTQVCAAGTCRGTSQESPGDTVISSYTIAGDSVVGTTQPYADKQMGGAMVVDNWVARPAGNQVAGTGTITLAAKPDSVLMRYRLAGTRTP
ncbi:MAG TPA: hypothetical protein VFD64_05295 [Gemmatimonadaceae bacterium]|nr:hypothetical protein [Gemmatimonadaceae bacterium]